jgi:carboxymethylenebutenolidase
MKRRKLLLASSGLLATSLFADSTVAQPRPSTQGTLVSLGKDLKGYYVRPRGNSVFPAVVVIMEAFGLNANIKDFCNRLASAGYAAIAPDVYHGATFPYTNSAGAIAKLKTLNDDTVMAEIGQAIQFLETRKEVLPKSIGVTGFCMGGRYAFLTSATYPKQIKASVCFYGGGIAGNPDALGRKSLLDQVPAIQTPVMLLYGAEDSLIAADEHERIALAMSAQKKQYTLTVFAKAGHGFMSDRRDSYQPKAAQEAWENTLSFFKRHLA